MKRISRSLLSLCLALVLCAALLPVNDAKATGGGTTARTGTSFLITGYRASRSSICTGDTVDITGYLSRTDGSNDSIRVVRGERCCKRTERRIYRYVHRPDLHRRQRQAACLYNLL